MSRPYGGGRSGGGGGGGGVDGLSCRRWEPASKTGVAPWNQGGCGAAEGLCLDFSPANGLWGAWSTGDCRVRGYFLVWRPSQRVGRVTQGRVQQ